jgi:hypothetical protein
MTGRSKTLERRADRLSDLLRELIRIRPRCALRNSGVRGCPWRRAHWRFNTDGSFRLRRRSRFSRGPSSKSSTTINFTRSIFRAALPGSGVLVHFRLPIAGAVRRSLARRESSHSAHFFGGAAVDRPRAAGSIGTGRLPAQPASLEASGPAHGGDAFHQCVELLGTPAGAKVARRIAAALGNLQCYVHAAGIGGE